MEKADVIHRLKSVALTPSEQRIAIYRFLCANPIHPTAETVWHALMPEFPTLSRTTVHNTLNIFVEHGLIQALTIENGEQRFDAGTHFHAHFKCTECGKLFDVPFDQKHVTPPQGLSGDVETTQLYYYGHCQYCKAGK